MPHQKQINILKSPQIHLFCNVALKGWPLLLFPLTVSCWMPFLTSVWLASSAQLWSCFKLLLFSKATKMGSRILSYCYGTRMLSSITALLSNTPLCISNSERVLRYPLSICFWTEIDAVLHFRGKYDYTWFLNKNKIT